MSAEQVPAPPEKSGLTQDDALSARLAFRRAVKSQRWIELLDSLLTKGASDDSTR